MSGFSGPKVGFGVAPAAVAVFNPGAKGIAVSQIFAIIKCRLIISY